MTQAPLAWFEPLYARADGNPALIPWAHLRPHPLLESWLDQPGLEVADADTLVVGCGLGDDADELARRGCRVTAFDLSGTAVAWARDRHGDGPDGARHPIRWEVADLFQPPENWRGMFGLVVEVRTIQSLTAELRDAAMQAIAGFVGTGGFLLHIGLLATSAEAAEEVEGPPWPLAPAELVAYEAAGLERLALEHPSVGDDRTMEIRATFRREDRAGPVVQ